MSALTNEKGSPSGPQSITQLIGNASGTLSGSGVIDASGEKVAFIGSVWHPTVKTGTINIRKVHWLAGAISSFNASSNFRVSIQGLSATAGPPYQPDGTIKGTGNNGYYDYGVGVSPTASSWNTTGAFGADVAVDLSADSLGDTNSRWIAVVFEYSAFTSTTSVIINTNQYQGNIWDGLVSGTALYTTSWSYNGTLQPICVLECDDGTFAFLNCSVPWTAFNNASVSSSAAIRRAGLKFKVPTERKVDRIALQLYAQNGSDGRFVLYDSDGTTELRSVDLDNDSVASHASVRAAWALFEPVTLAADTYYRFVFVGGTTTASLVYYGDVNAAGHMDALPGGQEMHWTQHDGASWSDTTTRRPMFAMGFSAFHDGAGGGGGLAANPIAGFVA